MDDNNLEDDDVQVLDDESTLEDLSESIADELIDHLTLDLCHQTHRATKLGYFQLEESILEEEKKYQLVDLKGHDVFGESSLIKKQYECVCPHCERTLAAARFAPHLEKCLGMGRNSSRIANKRIASSGRTNGGNNSTSGGMTTGSNNGDSDLDDSDNEWTEKPIVKKSNPRKKQKISGDRLNGVKKTNRRTESQLLVRNSHGQFASPSIVSQTSATNHSLPEATSRHSTPMSHNLTGARNSPSIFCSNSKGDCVSSASTSGLSMTTNVDPLVSDEFQF